ncbi:hypothetical protein F2Q69_00006109 [Brassica cretica]|uniref:Uncharacterized protein n=1 Tax=Brassica cretica TaxID=69181 RepID=A0A8S9P4N4_BRACR|nr:hypothetical protein F2Q69_00006109 [Brassica cretica]
MSIDAELLTSIDMDARTWIKHILRPFEADKPHQVTKIPMDDQKSYLCLEQVKEQRREIQEARCHFEGFDAEQPSRTTGRLFPKRTSV